MADQGAAEMNLSGSRYAARTHAVAYVRLMHGCIDARTLAGAACRHTPITRRLVASVPRHCTCLRVQDAGGGIVKRRGPLRRIADSRQSQSSQFPDGTHHMHDHPPLLDVIIMQMVSAHNVKEVIRGERTIVR